MKWLNCGRITWMEAHSRQIFQLSHFRKTHKVGPPTKWDSNSKAQASHEKVKEDFEFLDQVTKEKVNNKA